MQARGVGLLVEFPSVGDDGLCWGEEERGGGGGGGVEH